MKSICLWIHFHGDIIFSANTREEVQRNERLSVDSVTCPSGLMKGWSGLPDVDVFGLPIP